MDQEHPQPATPESGTKVGCCPPKAATTCGPVPPEKPQPCCPAPEIDAERPGYRIWPFVAGWLQTAIGPVPQVKTRLDSGDRFGRWQMRWGLGRNRYRIAPGLYAVGNPGPDSPVLVSANY